ncbi:MAG: prepilin-type N-terminal cleavage/methylation domain-containing protein [Planctomycetaceae bacterium]|nr:prepilin-type N-terminal cleavage/methylation domain-containing protein [Planctomycetaceae bacterium]
MKRPGYTLIELITVMAVMSVVMGVSVVLLVQLFDFQRNTDEYADRSRAVDHLTVVFRNDVRTYGKPEILTDGTALLRWTTETETIEYTAQPGEFPEQLNVVRTEQKEGENRFETYHLPDRTTFRFVEGKDDDTGLIALSLWIAPLGTEMPNLDELNPFDRTIPKDIEERVNPKYAGNWRTIIARY